MMHKGTSEKWGEALGGAILVGLALPALPALHAHLSSAEERRSLLAGCLALVLVGTIGYLRGIPFVLRRRSVVPLVVASASGLYAALIVWNHAFLRVAERGDHEGDVFRGAFRRFSSPIYGVPEIPDMTDFAWVGLPIMAFALLFVLVSARWNISVRRFALLVCGFQLVMISAFAATQSTERLIGSERDYYSFAVAEDLDRFDDLLDVFADWNDSMATLNLRNRHYPPGNLFMMKVGRDVGFDGLFRFLVIAATLGTTLLTLPLAHSLQISERGQRLAALLLATSTGPLVFPTSFVAPLTMFFATGAVVCLLRALRATSGIRHAVMAGALLGLCGLFSFVVFTIGTMIGSLIIVRIVGGQSDVVRSVRVGAGAVAGIIGVLAVMRIGFGFDFVECLTRARENATELMGTSSFDDPTRYLLRSTGNILAYLVYTGGVLVGLAVTSLRKSCSTSLRVFGSAIFLALLISGFSGQFWLETERIWVFFTPMLAVLAAGALDPEYEPSGPDEGATILGGNLLTSGSQELWHLHYI